MSEPTRPLRERIKECIATMPHRRQHINDKQLIDEMYALIQEVAETMDEPEGPPMAPEDDGFTDKAD